MKINLRKITKTLVLLFFCNSLWAAEISVPGFDGITFDDSQASISVTDSFTVHGLTIAPNDLTLEYSSNTFSIYGDITVEIDDQELTASLGTSDSPGITIEDGSLTDFTATISADFQLGNLEVEVEDAYISVYNETFYLQGSLIMTEVWSVELDLGDDDGGGLEIDLSGSSPSFSLDSWAIEIDDADIGSIDLKELKISFSDGTISEAEAKVYFPPGWEVDADITFTGNPATVSSVDISWEADDIEDAIAVGETGIEIVYIEGSMENTEQLTIEYTEVTIFGITIEIPSGYSYTYTDELQFTGDLGLTFGGPFSISDYEVALIYNLDEVTITSSTLTMSADLLIGAYKDGDDWNSLLGYGDIDLTCVWDDYYEVSATAYVPTDYMIKGDFDATVTSDGNLGALFDVKFVVPSSIPIIGGTTLGSVDGALKYIDGDVSSSYGAGWTSYWWWGTHYAGAKYKFSSRSISIIGSSTISDIKSDISDLDKKKSTSWVKEVKSFDLPERQHSVLFELDFGQEVEEAYISVIGPDGFYNLKELEITSMGDTIPHDVSIGDDLSVVRNDSSVTFVMVNHYPENDDAQHEQTMLNPGNYDVLISYKSTEGIDSTDINIHHFYPNSFGTIEATENNEGRIDLDLSYWAHYTDQSYIHLFVSTNDTSYNGQLFGVVEFGEGDEDGYGNLQVTYSPSNVQHGDSLSFYFAVEDSTNVAFYSEITDPIEYIAPIHGNVSTYEGDSISHGWKVYLDLNGNGSHDKDTTGTYEPVCTADIESHLFYFDHLEVGKQYSLNIAMPKKYQQAADSPNELPYVFTYDGTPLEIDFKIEEK